MTHSQGYETIGKDQGLELIHCMRQAELADPLLGCNLPRTCGADKHLIGLIQNFRPRQWRELGIIRPPPKKRMRVE